MVDQGTPATTIAVVVGALAAVVIVYLARRAFDEKRRKPMSKAAQVQYQEDLASIIETVARQVVSAHPTLDLDRTTQLVADIVRTKTIADPSLYTYVIRQTVDRLRGGEAADPPPAIQRWTD
jgi:hypothetical protein